MYIILRILILSGLILPFVKLKTTANLKKITTTINSGNKMTTRRDIDPLKTFCKICYQDDEECCKMLRYNNFDTNLNSSVSEICNIKIDTDHYVYSISKCDKNWKDASFNFKMKCENDEESLSVPVYSVSTNRTFKNILCALCNHESSASLKFFRTTISMLFSVQPSSNLILEHCSKSGNCMIYHQTPDKYIQGKRCYPQMEYCSKNIKSKTFIDACKKNQLTMHKPIYAKKLNLTKYKFCQRCFENNKEIALVHNMGIYTMDILFRLNFLNGQPRLSYETVSQNSLQSFNSTCEDGISSGDKNVDKYLCDKNILKNSSLQTKVPITKTIKVYLTFFGQLLSIICLVLLLVLYFTTKDTKNTPAKMIISLSFALLCAQFVFLLSGPLENQLKAVKLFKKINMCYVFGMLIHYFYLAYFFWSNMVSFDLFMRLGWGSKKLILKRNETNKSYIMYSIIAWCSPIVLIFLLITSQFYRKDHLAYAVKVCYLLGLDLILFFIVPVAIILLINTLLFIITSLSIKRINTNASFKKKNDWKRFNLFVKLFLVMGISWILGVLCTFIDEPILWCVYVIVNSIEGVYLFIAYGLNRETIDKLRTFKCFERIINVFYSKIETTTVN